MSERPSFHEVYMRLAEQMARRSTCERKSGVDGSPMKVGCVIVSADFRRMLAVGYNGNAAGLPNQCDDATKPGACGCIHAEANAVISCVEPRTTPKIVFCTHQPCPTCSKYLIQLGGVVKVFYWHPYRVKDGIEFLHSVGIDVDMLILPE